MSDQNVKLNCHRVRLVNQGVPSVHIATMCNCNETGI